MGDEILVQFEGGLKGDSCEHGNERSRAIKAGILWLAERIFREKNLCFM